MQGLACPITASNLAARRARAELVLKVQVFVRPDVVEMDNDSSGLVIVVLVIVGLFDQFFRRLSSNFELFVVPLVQVV